MVVRLLGPKKKFAELVVTANCVRLALMGLYIVSDPSRQSPRMLAKKKANNFLD